MAGNQKPNRHVTRIKMSMPQGYMLGRTSPGEGPVEMIPISGGSGNDLATRLIASGTVQGNAGDTTEYLGFFLEGVPTAAALFYGAVAPYPVSAPSGKVESNASCVRGSFGTFVMGIYTASLGHIGDITWARNLTAGVVTWVSPPYTIPAYEPIYLLAPTITDIQISRIHVVLTTEPV